MDNYWTRRRLSRRNLLRSTTLGVVGLTTASLVGCGDDDVPSATPTSAPAGGGTPIPTSIPTVVQAPGPDADAGMLAAPGSPKRGGTVTTSFWGRIGDFDQHKLGNRAILSQMYDTLVRANPLDGLQTIIPRLSTGWEVPDDGLTYTFKIRPGVEFHDGTPLTADDVAMSLRRLAKLGEFGDGTSRFFSELDMMENAEAVDSETVVATLNKPRAYFLEMLADPGKVIYSEKHINDTGLDITARPLPGTGPFVFEEHRSEEITRFKSNRTYWNPELPYIDELHMLHTVQWPDRATAILGGQADYANIVPAEFYEDRDRFKGSAGVARHDGTRASLSFFMNQTREPFNNPMVRRAIFLAVNRPALIDAYPESMSLAGSRWVSDSSPVATPLDQLKELPGYRGEDEQSIAEAKRLLEAAGYGDGLSGLRIVSNTNQAHSEILAPAFQAELKNKLNIETVLSPLAGNGRDDAASNRDFELLLHVGFRSPVGEFVTAWKDGIKTGASRNYGDFSNSEVDSYIDRIDGELDAEARSALYGEAMDLLDEQVPHYVVAFTQHNAMWSNRLEGHLEEIRGYTEEGTWDLFWLNS